MLQYLIRGIVTGDAARLVVIFLSLADVPWVEGPTGMTPKITADAQTPSRLNYNRAKSKYSLIFVATQRYSM